MLPNRSNGLANAFAVALLLANLLLFVLLWRLWALTPWSDAEVHVRLGSYLGVVFIGLFYVSRRLYAQRARITALPVVDRIAFSLRLVVGFLLGAALIHFATGPQPPERLFILAFIAASFPFNFLMLRLLPEMLVRRFFPRHQRGRVVLVGAGALPASLRDYLDRSQALGIEIAGYHSDAPLPGLPWPYLGTVDALRGGGRAGGPAPDCVVAYNFDHTAANFRDLVRHCASGGIRLQAFARLANLDAEPVELVADGDLNFLVFMKEPLEDPLNRLIKRALDLAVAIPVVFLLLPWLTLLVWIIQRRYSPGPILFKQVRFGANRRPFQIYKFRTMHQAASDLGREFVQARAGDPRVYPLGDFLRRSSLDEFPQFLNVLKGEMSVVGPRPHPIKLDQDMEGAFLAYRSRHFVRPGITGYAQVLGLRGETPHPGLMVERVRRDLQYISGWSLTFDLKIILQTAWQMVSPPARAY